MIISDIIDGLNLVKDENKGQNPNKHINSNSTQANNGLIFG